MLNGAKHSKNYAASATIILTMAQQIPKLASPLELSSPRLYQTRS